MNGWDCEDGDDTSPIHFDDDDDGLSADGAGSDCSFFFFLPCDVSFVVSFSQARQASEASETSKQTSSVASTLVLLKSRKVDGKRTNRQTDRQTEPPAQKKKEKRREEKTHLTR